MNTTHDTCPGRTITIEITEPDGRVTLENRLYASMSTSTQRYPEDTHEVTINLEDGDIHLHFSHLLLSLSVADWGRLVSAAADLLDAADRPGGVKAYRAKRGIYRQMLPQLDASGLQAVGE